MRVTPRHTAEQLADLIRAESRAKPAVRLALLGHTAAAGQVLLSERQVRTWVACSNAAGTAGLADAAGRGRKPPRDAAQRVRLAARLRAGPTPADGVYTLRGEDVRRILRGEFGVLRGLQAVSDLLHRLGFEPLRPSHGTRPPRRMPSPPSNGLPDRLAEVAAARPGESVEVWFEDEARFGRRGALTTVWAEGGSRPTALKQTAYADVHVLTAVCPATGAAESLVTPPPNTGVAQSFLDHLSAKVAPGVHAVLVWDGAGYRSASKALRCPATVTLPQSSPELNPVERQWAYVRQHHWSDRVHAGIDAVEAAAAEGWRAVCLKPERVRTVCRCEYLADGS